MSVVARYRKELEARGEYVAKVNTPWFAIRLKTWRERSETAKRCRREGPNLILYAESASPRNHYVIPHAIVRERLEEVKPRLNSKDGLRWDFTITDGRLEHNPKTGHVPFDVREFHEAPLVVEIPPELVQPTADPDELERRVESLLQFPLERPIGQPQPRRIAAATPHATYERRADVKAWVLREARGRCELCRCDAPFKNVNDEGYLELHHVHQLAEGGPDIVENAVALCPNCHRRLHHGADRAEQRSLLYDLVSRLQPVPSPLVPGPSREPSPPPLAPSP